MEIIINAPVFNWMHSLVLNSKCSLPYNDIICGHIFGCVLMAEHIYFVYRCYELVCGK